MGSLTVLLLLVAVAVTSHKDGCDRDRDDTECPDYKGKPTGRLCHNSTVNALR